MTAVPIPRQVIDSDAVLAKSRCIFQSSWQWYFIDFVVKFGDLILYAILAAAENSCPGQLHKIQCIIYLEFRIFLCSPRKEGHIAYHMSVYRSVYWSPTTWATCILRLPYLDFRLAGTKINGSLVAKGDHFCSRAPETFLLTRPCGDWKLSVVNWVQIQSQKRKVNLWRVLMKWKDTFCK